MPSGRVLGFILFVGVMVLSVGLLALVSKSSPEKNLKKTLSDEPSNQALRELLNANEDVSYLVVSEWNEGQRQEWQNFLATNADSYYANHNTDVICRDARSLQRLRIWPSELDQVLVECTSYEEAKEALATVNDRNRTANSEYRRKERAVANARDEVAQATRSLRDIEQSLYHFTGWIHGRLAGNNLEVSEVIGGRWGGKRYVLRTTSSDFSTTGRFQMYVQRGSDVRIDLTNGGSAVWPELVEANTFGLTLARSRLVTAREDLATARRRLGNISAPELTATEPYERRHDMAQQSIKTALRVPEIENERPQPEVEPEEEEHFSEEEERLEEGHPLMIEVTERSTQVELMDALCTGDSVRGEPVCQRCPPGFEGSPPLRLASSYVGRLSDRGINEAVLGLRGCAQGFNFENGTAFMSFEDGAWRTSGTYPEMATSDCETITINGRRILLCNETLVGGGSASTTYSAVMADNELSSTTLISLQNNEAACHFQGDFSEVVDRIFLTDVTGDGDRELVFLLSIQTGRHLYERSDSDPCADRETGRVAVSTWRTARVFQRRGDQIAELELSLEDIVSSTVREYLEEDNALPDISEQVEDILDFEEDSPTAWQIYRRRLAAMRHAEQFTTLISETSRIASLFPDHRELLYIELAEACEEAARYGCAASAYEKLIEEELSARALGRITWFYVTAPTPHRDTGKATRFLRQAQQADRFNGLAAVAQAEILLRRVQSNQATEFLENYLLDNDSELAEEYLSKLKDGSAERAERPRPLVPKQEHKVPKEWGNRVPEGPLSQEERLFAIELQAIDHRRSRRFDQAEALYWKALELTTLPEVARSFRLGLGRTYESAGRHEDAFALYEVLYSQEPDAPDVLNRFAWALLTTESEVHKDITRGRMLAQRAAVQTNRQDPSILDTLAEAHIINDERDAARSLLQLCIELDPTRTYYQTRLEELEGDSEAL